MKLFSFVAIILLMVSCVSKEQQETILFNTVCNPMDLSYRFRPEENNISRREAADPTVIRYKNSYYLFASKSGGYWKSDNLLNWSFIEAYNFPTEDYAPTAIVLRDTIFVAVSSKKNNKIYKCAEPDKGIWQTTDSLDFPVEDPFLFQDDDKKLYLYWGCSNIKPLFGAEIDTTTFAIKSEIENLIYQNPTEYGWEVRGDYNTDYENAPWLEGLWMNKYNGKYYLQYAAPGTREKSYSDGMYTSNSPLGPFTLAQHNPFAYKPEGFACGAGHGSTFADEYGNFWHLGTISISVKDKFERRIAFYPAFFDKDSVLYTNTYFGDYPMIIPNKKINSSEDVFPGWMLLSYNKKVETSSILEEYKPENLNDENIRTYWCAESGNNNEWAKIDLGKNYDIYTIQINFAEHNTSLHGRVKGICHQYTIEASVDGNTWNVIIDKSNNNNDNTHVYTQLLNPIQYRYLKVNNIKVPEGNFAISGFRVFGKGKGTSPEKPQNLTIIRNENDKRVVTLNWNKVPEANGYNLSYGANPNKLYHNYLVYSDTTVTIRSLNANQDYYFNIRSFNENGISK